MVSFYTRDELRRALPEYSDFKTIAENDKGAVFDVFSMDRGHRLALKLTADRGDDATRSRFEREFDILFANQHHERLVRLYGERGYRPVRMFNGNVINHFFFTMKLYHRDVYKALVEKSLDVGMRIDAVMQLLDGLAYLHAKGIAHRDIKPANLFLEQPPPPVSIKLGDFDIAKAQLSWTSAVTLAPVGTLHYLAPERWIPGEEDQDWRPSDQYAAGVTAFQVLSLGVLPLDFRAVRGSDPRAYEPVHRQGQRLPLRIPERQFGATHESFPRLDRILHRMLEVNPADRFPDITQCQIALRGALAGYGLWPAQRPAL